MVSISRSSSRGIRLALLLAPSLALVMYACDSDRSSPSEPMLLGARTAARTVTFSVNAEGSTAGGTITSTRGGINCTVTVSGGVVNKSGRCSQEIGTGATITVNATPSASGATSKWKSGCTGVTESPQSCEVTLDQPRTATAVFSLPANTFPLHISGGAGGNGQVSSVPQGIGCVITAGVAGTSGCTANFASGASVTLGIIASSGSYIKAWAGAGCDTAGTGKGSVRGSCTFKMSAAENVVVSFERTTPVAASGEWAAPITWPVVAIHAALLPNAHVLTWGRSDKQPVVWTPPTTVGASGSFVSTPETSDLFCSGHTFLPDGRILVAGGHSGTNSLGIRNSAIFNFATNTFTAGPVMQNGRWYPTNTALASGEVLTMSGGDTVQQRNLIPEVYQANGTWRVLSTASLYLPYYPMNFVTPTGTVFAAGPAKTTYFLDPTGTGHWTAGPSSLFGSRDYGSAVMYEVGKIFMVGGGDPPTATAEVIDINGGTGAWRSVASMAVARRQSNATILADGKVLVTGGTNAGGFNSPPTNAAVLAAELWDPSTEHWTTLARMTHYRVYHSTALLLPDGRVLSVGSGAPAAAGLTDDFTAEIFSPPYLFNGDGTLATRPTITAAPASVTYNQAFTVATSAPASVSKVMWISLGSVTHSYNENQRAMRLTFTAGTSGINVTAPARAALAPPGYYLLFILDNRGVPSLAKIVHIG
jgi:hypothetical protein